MVQTTVSSPIGLLTIEASDGSITAVRFGDDTNDGTNVNTDLETPATPLLGRARAQIMAYFEGDRTTFKLPLAPKGTSFEREVWQALQAIPFGHTITYADLARNLGDRNKLRAVGRANGQNPLPILIPCHRVIGSDNKLTGYAGGIARKQWLLQHEGAILL